MAPSARGGNPQPSTTPAKAAKKKNKTRKNKSGGSKYFTLTELNETIVPVIIIDDYPPPAIKESGRKNPQSLC
jgi:hypothetical protein